MRVLLFLFVVLNISLSTHSTALKSSEDHSKMQIFVTKFLKFFTDVVNDLKTRISKLNEEVRILRAKMSEINTEAYYIEVKTAENTQALRNLIPVKTGDYVIGRLQANVSRNEHRIQNLETKMIETEIKVSNLTNDVSQNTITLYNLQANGNIAIDKNETRDKPKSCFDLQSREVHSTSGVYDIFPIPGQTKGTAVYCDLETKGGGWTVFQSRSDKGPRVDFYRNWNDYEKGFGTPGNEHWMGLENLSAMTAYGDQELRVELTDWADKFAEANYSKFKVANETQKYLLTVGNYSGTAGDSLEYHDSAPFTTQDHDNDTDPNGNCAKQRQGAWWYKNCAKVSLSFVLQSELIIGHFVMAPDLVANNEVLLIINEMFF